MMGEIAGATFDYAALDAVVASEVRLAAKRIRRKLGMVVREIIAIGRDLIEVKARLPHGQFGPWLVTEIGMTERTARNYMRASEVFGDKSEAISFLAPSIVYRLALPSTPPDVRDAVLARTEAGETVTADEIGLMVRHAGMGGNAVQETIGAGSDELGHDGQDEADDGDGLADSPVDEMVLQLFRGQYFAAAVEEADRFIAWVKARPGFDPERDAGALRSLQSWREVFDEGRALGAAAMVGIMQKAGKNAAFVLMGEDYRKYIVARKREREAEAAAAREAEPKPARKQHRRKKV